MNTCYIGLGSNLGDSVQTLHSALRMLATSPQVQLKAVSRFYTSQPMGPQDQPDYVNAVAGVETELSAQALLKSLFTIEKAHGRDRKDSVRWGARTLDLDLLLYGQALIHEPNLKVPHPGMCERAFVVLPLLDIAPHLVLPHGQPLKDCLEQLVYTDLHPLNIIS